MEAVHRSQQTILQGQPRGPGLHDEDVITGNLARAVEAKNGRRPPGRPRRRHRWSASSIWTEGRPGNWVAFSSGPGVYMEPHSIRTRIRFACRAEGRKAA